MYTNLIAGTIDIAELNTNIAEIVQKQSELRTQIDAIVKDIEG